MRTRLARQLAVPAEDPIVAAILEGMPQLGSRAAMLAIRGATNAIVTGARMQIVGALCAFCHDAADSWSHFTRCAVALSAFCEALGLRLLPCLVQVLRDSEAPVARAWSAFIDFVAVACATRGEVISRSPTFLSAAAAALARAHISAPAAADAAAARHRQARPRAHTRP